jgi:hypothetical protein
MLNNKLSRKLLLRRVERQTGTDIRNSFVRMKLPAPLKTKADKGKLTTLRPKSCIIFFAVRFKKTNATNGHPGGETITRFN